MQKPPPRTQRQPRRQPRPPPPPSLERAAAANITAVLGASQTGKGMYCRERLRRPHAGVTAVWSFLEKTDHYADFLGAPSCADIVALCKLLAGGARAVVYTPLPDRLADQFDYFCRIVAELPRARVLVEELSRVTLPHWAPPHWRNLSTAGAHAHLELIATAQSPSQIDKSFLGNASELRCYRLLWEGDARRLGSVLRVPHAELMDLPRFHYRHRVIEERVTRPGVQAVVT